MYSPLGWKYGPQATMASAVNCRASLPSTFMVQISALLPSGLNRRHTILLSSGLKNGPPSYPGEKVSWVTLPPSASMMYRSMKYEASSSSSARSARLRGRL